MAQSNRTIPTISAQQSWATQVSDYIIKRRQQTATAYKSTELPMNSQSRAVSGEQTAAHTDESDALFRAFFILLASQLEEGHTVLTLTQAANEAPSIGHINGKAVSLYAWQVQVLQILTAPLVDYIDADEIDSDALSSDESASAEQPSLNVRAIQGQLTIFEIMSVLLTKKEQLWWHASVNSAQVVILKQRLQLVLTVYQQLSRLSLSALIAQLQQHDLFEALVNEQQSLSLTNKNSLSKSKQAPNIYHTKYHKSEQQPITLTLWLHRAWQAEYNLAMKVKQILNNRISPLDIDIPEHLNAQQVNAVEVANNNAFSIITGGPGTGKTYTVAQLVMALQQAQDKQSSAAIQPRITFSTDSASLALAAPTGKAAQRMQESLQAALDAAGVEMQLQEAKTIHRLLGIGRTGKPRYNADNPLGEDIIIVDEASMLGVELANYLVSAVKPGARLILLGDANQLAAVDAGAVLADLCRTPLLTPIHAQLTESRRFGADSGIGQLATLINQSQVDVRDMWQLIQKDEVLHFENTQLSKPSDKSSSNNQIINSLSNKNQIHSLTTHYANYVSKTHKLLTHSIATSMPEVVKQTITELMAVFNQFRILSAGHHGEWGDHFINDYLTQWHTNELKLLIRQDNWYHGRPVMVLQNNYELGLFNGDIGICLQTAGDKGRLEVFFENKTQGIAVNLLNDALITTAYAMTIHKSQGSEFDHVAIALDNSHSRLLSKELIYTAVTRAKKQVTIYSSKSALEKAVQTPTQRHTGLALQFETL
ncbi:exodeoxyribonuclease V subunit alpha [Psychrobacter sp. FDAARGOS_221]|uniref:exodeoxyribonuclease V subunit alpha n=1 Tax=Psychrobacter sp. FDAARGOS_221 TaxID=1975705 RepID=UPI000BB55848|nr:exodeoxyribonuclease V subunit alpha [Psychrobacter sp. FDAARGOS_221]PNK59653.1 exodeoxyribonuclease V subunit alpha [Psychrobacter sp. FDAARGOS_221]